MGSGLTQPFFLEERFGPAAELFDAQAWSDVSVATIRVLTVSAPTIVLGSSQSFDVVDIDECASVGVHVVRRRSGGGAVWVNDDMVWVDVFVPADHVRWDDDIGRSTWWLGQAWADSLAQAGVSGAVVHRESMVRTKWSSLICFAGLGAGEVSVGTGKAVGISQRRSRAGALFQCGVVRAWDPTQFVRLLRFPDEANRSNALTAARSAAFEVGPAAHEALRHLITNLTNPNPNPKCGV